jgi:hypothetical protein
MDAMSSHLEAVTSAAKVFRKAESAAKRARAELRAAILAATNAGERQVDIAEASTYKREQVRRIVDAARKSASAD